MLVPLNEYCSKTIAVSKPIEYKRKTYLVIYSNNIKLQVFLKRITFINSNFA